MNNDNNVSHAKECNEVAPVKKMFIIKKVKDKEHIMSLLKQINTTFENKDMFLNTNNTCFTINNFPYSSNKCSPLTSTSNSAINIRKHNVSQKVNNMYHHNTTSESVSPRRSYHVVTSSSTIVNNPNESESNTSQRKRKLDYKLVDEKVLKCHFNELKTLEQQNKPINNEMLFTNLPPEIKRHLLVQERKLFHKRNEDKRLSKLSNYLCKRTNKKVNDLLIHQHDSYQFKRQAQNAVDQYKNSHGRVSSEAKWMHSLRLSNESNSDIMNHYMNIRTHSNPLWIVNSKRSCSLFGNDEIKRKPKMISNACYNNYIKKTIMNNEVSRNTNMKRLHYLTHLEVKGTNLLTLERENEKGFKGKKILYNKGQLDTLNIKATNQCDFDKEYTNMIKNKLIIQNY